MYFAGITDHPTGVWATQAARSLLLRHADGLSGTRALVRDRASQFIDAFDEIFRTERMKILKTPVRTPVANAFAERWIGTLRRELLDRTIIWNRRQLNNLVVDSRLHRSLQHAPAPPFARSATTRRHRRCRPARQTPPSRENGPLWWTHQRVPKCRLTTNDTVSGTHTAASSLVSGGREPPPPALLEPYVTVSRHTAPTVRRWVEARRCQ